MPPTGIHMKREKNRKKRNKYFNEFYSKQNIEFARTWINGFEIQFSTYFTIENNHQLISNKRVRKFCPLF